MIHLVRDEEGAFVAFSGTSSHLGGMVPWYPERQYESLVGVFMEPCHNETWARDGTRVFGPAPRDLDRFALRLDDGRVIVDPTDVTEGDRPPPPPPWDDRTPSATTEATQLATPVATFMPTSTPATP